MKARDGRRDSVAFAARGSSVSTRDSDARCGAARRVSGLRSAAVPLAVFLAACLAAGCGGGPQTIPGVVEGVEQEDIPIPQELHFVKSTQYTPEGVDLGEFRSWVGIYSGPVDGDRLAAWFVREMPQRGWKYLGMQVMPRHRKTLKFYKGNEEAVIEIARDLDMGSGRYESRVKASIHPRPIETFTDEEEGAPPARPASKPEEGEVPRPPPGTSGKSEGPVVPTGYREASGERDRSPTTP